MIACADFAKRRGQLYARFAQRNFFGRRKRCRFEVLDTQQACPRCLELPDFVRRDGVTLIAPPVKLTTTFLHCCLLCDVVIDYIRYGNLHQRL
ncbi:hypothetical protein D3C86_1709570 [compost metagenome]